MTKRTMTEQDLDNGTVMSETECYRETDQGEVVDTVDGPAGFDGVTGERMVRTHGLTYPIAVSELKIRVPHTTPAQYVIDAGWDFGSIEATATKGVADEDLERLAQTDCTPDELLAYCREQVAASAPRSVTIKAYAGDSDSLIDAGCTYGAHWSEPGRSGYHVTLPDGTTIRIAETPASDDSLTLAGDDDVLAALKAKIEEAREAAEE
jgi:hypothetical protein